MLQLSIIIPAYNAEAWITRCLDSCLAQDVSKDLYEIIVVNDGSIDHTDLIAREYSIKYPNIIVLTKENGGLSSARNAGLGISKGEYVFFLDSDDWISPSSLYKIVASAKEKPDVISIGYKLVYTDGHFDTILPKKTASREILMSMNYPMGAPFWILSKSFIDKNYLSFVEGIFHEDNEFTPRMLYLAKTIRTIDYPIYNYFIQLQGTIISSKNIKKSYDLLDIIASYRLFAAEHVKKEDEFIFREHSLLAFNSCCANASQCSKEEKFDLYNFITNSNSLLQYLFQYKHYHHYKYILEAFCGRLSAKKLLRYKLNL